MNGATMIMNIRCFPHLHKDVQLKKSPLKFPAEHVDLFLQDPAHRGTIIYVQYIWDKGEIQPISSFTGLPLKQKLTKK